MIWSSKNKIKSEVFLQYKIYNLRVVLIFILLNSFTLFSQTINWNKFVSSDFLILDTAKGDLNQDGFIDGVLILKYKEESLVDSLAVKPVLIIEGQKNGSFILTAKNDNIVLLDALASPYPNIAMQKDGFSIETHGRGYEGKNYEKNIQWFRSITFKYDLKTREYILFKDFGGYCDVQTPNTYNKESYNKKEWNNTKFVDYIVSGVH